MKVDVDSQPAIDQADLIFVGGSMLTTASFEQCVKRVKELSDRPVVLFTGDGGFMMGGINEFNTAVRLGQDLVVVVCNDSAYGAEHIQFRDRDMDPGLTQFAWPSFAAVATALGGRGIEVRSPEDLRAAIDLITVRDRPILIDLRIDPNDVPRMRI